MHLTADHAFRDGYFWIAVAGRWDLGDAYGLVELIRRETDLAGVDRALADLRNVDGPVPGLDRFFAGKHVATVLGARVRLAVIARPEMIDKLGENTAVNRGARILVSGTEAEALAFLD